MMISKPIAGFLKKYSKMFFYGTFISIVLPAIVIMLHYCITEAGVARSVIFISGVIAVNLVLGSVIMAATGED